MLDSFKKNFALIYIMDFRIFVKTPEDTSTFHLFTQVLEEASERHKDLRHLLVLSFGHRHLLRLHELLGTRSRACILTQLCNFLF